MWPRARSARPAFEDWPILSGSPQSADEWLQLCRQHRSAATTLRDARQPNESWNHAGFALEAAIMKKEGLNRWPSTAKAPHLWTHDLAYLANRLGISYQTFDPRDRAAASWKLGLEWQRGHGYAVEKVPMKFAEQMCEAAFGSNGVVEWLAKRFHLNI
jgi:hypothetical protein